MSRLRFAMVTTFYPPHHFGGDAVFIRRLAHALARRGHAVEVIHDVDAFEMLHPGVSPGPIDEPDGVRTHPLRSRLGRLSCLATHQTGRPVVHGARIRRILEGGRFDVIHFHNVSLVGGPGVLAYGSGIKLVIPCGVTIASCVTVASASAVSSTTGGRLSCGATRGSCAAGSRTSTRSSRRAPSAPPSTASSGSPARSR